MLEAPIILVYILLFCVLFSNVVLILVGVKLIGVLGVLAKYDRPEDRSTPRISGSASVSTIQERQEVEIKVPEIAPELIAPHLKQPPKLKGFRPTSDS